MSIRTRPRAAVSSRPGVEAPLSRLVTLDRSMGLRNTTCYDPSLTPAPQLEQLREALRQGPVPAEVLRTIAGLAFSCLERAQADLAPGYRAREPVEQDREWAALCCDLIRSWCAEGRVQLVFDGKPVPPEQLEPRLIARPAARGSTLELLAPPRPPSGATETSLESLRRELPRAAHRVETPYLDQLENDADRAREVLARVLDAVNLVSNGDDIELVRRIVAEGRKREGLKQALRTHLPRLTRIASEAQARGRLDWNFLEGRGKVNLYRNLVELFPDCVDRRFLDEELVPLMLSDELNTSSAAAELLVELWKTRPELVGPALEKLTENPARKLEDGHFKMLQQAASEHGWRPDPKQARWIAARLELPSDQSLFRYDRAAEDFRKMLKVVAAVPPDVFAHVRPEGRTLPEFLLERLLEDPEPERMDRMYAELPMGVDPYRLMSDMRSVVFPQKGTSPLVARLEAELEGSDLRRLTARQQSALSLFAQLELPPEKEEAWAERLEPMLLELPPADKRDLKGTARFAERFRDAAVRWRLAREDARGAILLAYRTPPERGWQPSVTARAVSRVLEHLPAGLEAPPVPASLDGLPQEQLADVDLLVGLSRGDRQLREKLRPLAGNPSIPSDPIRAGVAARVLEALEDGVLGDLRRADLTAAERLELLGAGDAKRRKAFREGLQAALREGARSRLLGKLDDNRLRIGVQQLGDDHEAWGRLERLVGYFGEIGPALEASRHLEEALRAGKSEEDAWRAALRGYLAGGEPPAAGNLRVELGEDSVTIGAVRLPRRRDPGSSAQSPSSVQLQRRNPEPRCRVTGEPDGEANAVHDHADSRRPQPSDGVPL